MARRFGPGNRVTPWTAPLRMREKETYPVGAAFRRPPDMSHSDRIKRQSKIPAGGRRCGAPTDATMFFLL